MNLTVKSSRAGPCHDIPLPLLHPRFRIVPYDIHSTHLRLWLYFLFSFSSAYPLSVNSTPLAVLYRSQATNYTFSPTIFFCFTPRMSFLYFFFLHVHFLYLFHVRPRLFSFPLSPDDDHDSSFFPSTRSANVLYIHRTPIHLNCFDIWTVSPRIFRA